MKRWKRYCAGLAFTAGLTPGLWAQAPVVPVAPAVPTAAAVPAATPAGPNLWSFFCMPPEIKAACRAKLEKCCQTPFGQMLNNSVKPVSALSGGIFPTPCPEVRITDLAKPADSAEGAASRIKQDEANAKARRAAVRYLGTVDCHYWPEAQDALINSLRADRNECVRLEAALALGNGCCCNQATIEALRISVSGSQEDGNPSENSERVKAAAYVALHHCLAVCPADVAEPVEVVPVPKKEEPLKETTPSKETTPPKDGSAKQPDGRQPYYKRVQGMPLADVARKARRTVAQIDTANAVTMRPGNAGVYGLLMKAINPTTGAERPATPAEKPAVITPVRQDKPAVQRPAPEARGTVSPLSFLRPLAPRRPTMPPPVEVTPVIQQVPVVIPPITDPVPQILAPPIMETPPSVSPMPAPLQPPVLEVPPAVVPIPEPPVTPVQPSAPTHDLPPVLGMLRDSHHPEERAWAADFLSRIDWRTNPHVVPALLAAARRDTAPLVRVACVRSLARMGVSTMPVITTLQNMKNDADPRVRHEAGQALAKLAPDQTAAAVRLGNPVSAPR